MTRVYIGCFGSGLGHAARMLEIAGALTARGATVELSSSDEVATFIESRGYRCNRLPLADVRYSETGEFSLKDTLVASATILGRTFHQLGKELANINRFGPDVVISDSSLPSVLAAKFLGLPALTVLNQLNLTGPQYTSRIATRLLSAGISSFMGRLWEFSDEVLLPDLPPPYTISEKNLWGSHVSKTRYVGFLAMSGTGEPDATAKEFTSDRRPKVFWQVSGPPKTRTSFLRKALECAKMLADEYAFVIAEGSPTSDHVAHRIPGGWSYGWCDIAEVYFESCDVVVSRAGHGTIGQAISCSKPSLIVPIPKQPEQEGNAQKAVRLGTSLMMSQGDLEPTAVRKALHELRGSGHVSAARRLGSLSLRYDARAEIVKSVEAATSRVRRAQ